MSIRMKKATRGAQRHTRIIAALSCTVVSLTCLSVVLLSGLRTPSGKLSGHSFAVVWTSDQKNRGHLLIVSRSTAPESKCTLLGIRFEACPMPTTIRNTKTSMPSTCGTTAAVISSMEHTTSIFVLRHSIPCTTSSDTGKSGARMFTKERDSPGSSEAPSCCIFHILLPDAWPLSPVSRACSHLRATRSVGQRWPRLR